MKMIIYVLSALSLLLIFTTTVCGLWIRANNVVEASSLKFHATSGILSAIVTVALIILVLLTIKKVAL